MLRTRQGSRPDRKDKSLVGFQRISSTGAPVLPAQKVTLALTRRNVIRISHVIATVINAPGEKDQISGILNTDRDLILSRRHFFQELTKSLTGTNLSVWVVHHLTPVDRPLRIWLSMGYL